jgi:hypothetical protein
MTIGKIFQSFSLFALAAAVLLLAKPAHADSISFQLLDPVQNVSSGSTVVFSALIETTGNAAPIYLNGVNDGVDSPLILNDDAFFNLTPLELDANGSYTNALFSIIVPTGVSGAFNGYFDVQGGTDSSAGDTLATSAFELDVTNTSTAPEPSSISLFGFGLLAVAAFASRKGQLFN